MIYFYMFELFHTICMTWFNEQYDSDKEMAIKDMPVMLQHGQNDAAAVDADFRQLIIVINTAQEILF